MQINSRQSLTLPEVPKRPGVINCASYAQGVRVTNLVIADISEELKHEDRFVWVGLFEPDEKLLREIQEEFCLHDLAIEDALCGHQGPKLEQYGNSLFVVLRTAHLAGESQHVEFAETHVFVGRATSFLSDMLAPVTCGFARTLRGFQASSRQGSGVCPLRPDGFCSRTVFPHPRGVRREGG